MKPRLKLPMALAICVLLAGCVATLPALPTPLEIQSLQTREYEEDKQVVFASVMSVFQDLGYIVNGADLATGFITTESAATSDLGFLDFLLSTTRVVQTRATAFIETIDANTRVRLNFVETSRQSTLDGPTNRHDMPVLDAAIYRNAFERIENAIFVRTSN